MNHQIRRRVVTVRAMRTRQKEVWDAIESLDEKMAWLNERISQIDKRLGKHTIKTDERLRLNDEWYKLYFKRSDLEREKMEARIAADRASWKEELREREVRAAADRESWTEERREREARAAADLASWKEERREMEARIAADRKETADRLAADRESWAEERRMMEARIAADRKETADRLAADRKETADRLEADRKDFQQERKETKREFTVQKRWLIATFVTVFVGMCSIFTAIVILIMQLT